jgi:hypothetical protein
MWSMQCHLEFGYQLSICSGTKENHGKPWSSWPVAGPSGCKMTSSQQCALNIRALTLVPICVAAFFLPFSLFFFHFYFFSQVVLYNYFYVRMIWKSTKPCIKPAEGINTYINNMHTNIHISVSVIFWLSVNLVPSEFEFFLRLTVSQPIHLGIGPLFGTLDQILSCSSFSADNYLILLSKAGKRVCSLRCNHSLVPIAILYHLT